LLNRDRRPERHREVLLRDTFRLGQRARFVAEEAELRLEMQRRHVIRGGADLRLDERLANTTPLGRAADEQVVDVAGLVPRQVDELAETELCVARRSIAAAAVPFVEVR